MSFSRGRIKNLHKNDKKLKYLNIIDILFKKYQIGTYVHRQLVRLNNVPVMGSSPK